MPEGPTISDWFQVHGVQRTNFGHEIKLTPANIAELSDLASAFAAITRKPYEVRAYKFVVPRVASSLRHLQAVLAGAWA